MILMYLELERVTNFKTKHLNIRDKNKDEWNLYMCSQFATASKYGKINFEIIPFIVTHIVSHYVSIKFSTKINSHSYNIANERSLFLWIMKLWWMEM